jgi:hypothetical protein
MRMSASHLPSDGNHYTSMCLEIRCHTLKGEPQEIDYVLEIYHRCFFFNKVGEVKGLFVLLCFESMYSVSTIIVHPLWLHSLQPLTLSWRQYRYLDHKKALKYFIGII